MKASRDRGRSFPFLRINEREPKPRKRGLTEIRGPYYSVIGRRYLEDLFDTMGAYVDSLKFAGGSFTLAVSSNAFSRRAARPCGATSPNVRSSTSISLKSQPVLSPSRPMTGCA